MKTKKAIIISAIALLVIAAVIIGIIYIMNEITYRKNKDWWSEKISSKLSGNPPVGTLMELLDEDEDHNVKLSKLTTYDFWWFRVLNNTGRIPLTAKGSFSYFIDAYNSFFPIEHIEKVDSSHVCVIYKFEPIKNDIIYAYLIFEGYEETTNGISHELWGYTGETYFVDALLSSTDLKSLKVGDNAYDIYKIDKSISLDALYGSNYDPNEEPELGFTSYRLLKDGIMVIEFERDEIPLSNEETDKNLFLKHYTVSEMTFYPYNGDTIPTMPAASGEQSLVAFSSPNLVTAGR